MKRNCSYHNHTAQTVQEYDTVLQLLPEFRPKDVTAVQFIIRASNEYFNSNIMEFGIMNLAV